MKLTPSQRVASPKPRIVLPLIAALATFAASVAPATAASGSGGVSTDGGSESDQAPAESAKYVRLWDRVDRRDRRWARLTAECESGRDPNAIGGGGKYRGAFQFLKSTWRRAPKSPGGDPIDYTYKTQAVVAVALKNRAGTGHWPVCG